MIWQSSWSAALMKQYWFPPGRENGDLRAWP
jgi:hypothetical protein